MLIIVHMQPLAKHKSGQLSNMEVSDAILIPTLREMLPLLLFDQKLHVVFLLHLI